MAINCSSCELSVPASCVTYNGPSIPCIVTTTNSTLQEILSSLGSKVCSMNETFNNSITTINTNIANIAPGVLLTARVNLTSSQILNIFSTPVTVIPAPGVNKIIDVVTIRELYTFNSIAYATHVNLSYFYKDNVEDYYLTDDSNIINQTHNTMGCLAPSPSSISTSNSINNPLIVSNAIGNPTTGNGTVSIFVLYRILDIS